jgi:hypothetical protein
VRTLMSSTSSKTSEPSVVKAHSIFKKFQSSPSSPPSSLPSALDLTKLFQQKNITMPFALAEKIMLFYLDYPDQNQLDTSTLLTSHLKRDLDVRDLTDSPLFSDLGLPPLTVIDMAVQLVGAHSGPGEGGPTGPTPLLPLDPSDTSPSNSFSKHLLFNYQLKYRSKLYSVKSASSYKLFKPTTPKTSTPNTPVNVMGSRYSCVARGGGSCRAGRPCDRKCH